MSMRKIKVLCKRDFIDYFNNPALLLSLVVSVLFTLLYKFLHIPEASEEVGTEFVLSMGTLINCCICGIIIVSTTIAEEKEKSTLRTLMLSNVSGAEFLTAKLIVGVCLTMLGNIIIFFLSGSAVAIFPYYVLGTLLGSIVANLISAVIGICSRDQTQAGVLQVPVMFLLMIPSLFGSINKFCELLARVSPFDVMINIYAAGGRGNFFTVESAGYLGVMAVWIAAGAVAFLLAYRKRGLDN